MERNISMQAQEFFQTQVRGTNWDEYQIFLSCADDGHGRDITRGGTTLPTYEEWLCR